MASTSPQIYSPCQCARCQNAARVQSPAKVGNFPGQFTFMYVPIIRIWSNWVAVGYSLRLKYLEDIRTAAHSPKGDKAHPRHSVEDERPSNAVRHIPIGQCCTGQRDSRSEPSRHRGHVN